VNGCKQCFNGAMRALGLLAAVALALACARPASTADDPFAAARARMVAETIAPRGVKDERVLAAMRKVPRHEFLPAAARPRAYDDTPVPIGHGQTASQPYMVAVMTELAELGPRARVLEIGTGSGYQAAVLAEVAGEVYSIEILEPLATSARRTLERLGYGRVHVRHGDGYRGWPEAAPFDAIVVTAAPPEVPTALRDQLAPGGRLVSPIGRDEQELEVHRRTPDGFRVRRVFPVTFVPMVPAAQP
jgi:protein-L-isoaspartate(D-aspartate) O-methyltransferase